MLTKLGATHSQLYIICKYQVVETYISKKLKRIYKECEMEWEGTMNEQVTN